MQDLCQLPNELRNVDHHDFPNPLMVDRSIIVSKDIWLTDDVASGDFRMFFLESRRHLVSGFTDDLEFPFDGGLKHLACKIRLPVDACNKPRYGFSSLKHIPKIGQISVTRLHR